MKKTSKKIIALLLAVLTLAVLAGCGKEVVTIASEKYRVTVKNNGRPKVELTIAGELPEGCGYNVFEGFSGLDGAEYFSVTTREVKNQAKGQITYVIEGKSVGQRSLLIEITDGKQAVSAISGMVFVAENKAVSLTNVEIIEKLAVDEPDEPEDPDNPENPYNPAEDSHLTEEEKKALEEEKKKEEAEKQAREEAKDQKIQETMPELAVPAGYTVITRGTYNIREEYELGKAKKGDDTVQMDLERQGCQYIYIVTKGATDKEVKKTMFSNVKFADETVAGRKVSYGENKLGIAIWTESGNLCILYLIPAEQGQQPKALLEPFLNALSN